MHATARRSSSSDRTAGDRQAAGRTGSMAEVSGHFPGTRAGFVTFTRVEGGPTMGAPIGESGDFRMHLPSGTYRVVIASAAGRREIPGAVIDRAQHNLS